MPGSLQRMVRRLNSHLVDSSVTRHVTAISALRGKATAYQKTKAMDWNCTRDEKCKGRPASQQSRQSQQCPVLAGIGRRGDNRELSAT